MIEISKGLVLIKVSLLAIMKKFYKEIIAKEEDDLEILHSVKGPKLLEYI